MKTIGRTLSGTVIVEMTAEEFDAIGATRSPLVAAIGWPGVAKPEAPAEAAKMSPAELVNYVGERLANLRPKKRAAIIRWIKTTFQFSGGIEARAIERVIDGLETERFFVFDDEGRVTYVDSDKPSEPGAASRNSRRWKAVNASG